MSLKVNGKAYDWGDIDLQIPGLPLEIQEISYDDEMEKELVYGHGALPRGYGRGVYKASGKMTLLRDDYDDLLDYCRQQDVSFFDLVFPKIIVSYANEGDRTRQDILNRVSISKRSNKASNGDKSMKVDLDLMIAGTIEQDGVAPVLR